MTKRKKKGSTVLVCAADGRGMSVPLSDGRHVILYDESKGIPTEVPRDELDKGPLCGYLETGFAILLNKESYASKYVEDDVPGDEDPEEPTHDTEGD